MTEEQLSEKLNAGIVIFLENHRALLTLDANERSITHKVAECLALYFPGWDVDCEYNRDGYEPKRIGLAPEEIPSDDENAQTIFPDIIVHHRNKNGHDHNLLIIEAKKMPDSRSIASDKNKIEMIMRTFGYQFGAFLNITTGESANLRYEQIKIT